MRPLLILGTAICFAFCGPAEAAQDREHYRRALSDNSSSPYFVLITVTDDSTGKSVTGCVPAPFLVGAIFRELGGEPGDADREKTRALLAQAKEAALENGPRSFHFSKPAAIANVSLGYGESDLIAARKALGAIGVETMMTPGPDRQSLGKLQWSAALACAIIEQGASARRADITGQIYAEP